jgi:hypothetical protein
MADQDRPGLDAEALKERAALGGLGRFRKLSPTKRTRIARAGGKAHARNRAGLRKQIRAIRDAMEDD